MKPGDPSVISEWLTRSQKAPLTVIAEFNDSDEHPPCRYQDDATATFDDNDHVEVCPRHRAILSLDQPLPHRSRIRDLTIFLYSSDPDWDEDGLDGEPTLLYHHFFAKALPNLEYLDFRAAHVEQIIDVIPVPDSLFAGFVPRLKELKYLGVVRGLVETVKNLTSCEIGSWLESSGPAIIHPDQLRVFLNNNETLKSFTINASEPFTFKHSESAPTPMTNLEFLRIECYLDVYFEEFISIIHAPQFKDLHTVQLSLSSTIQAVATDSFGHTFQFARTNADNVRFEPLQHFGAAITTLRLDRGITLRQLGCKPALYNFFRSLDTVQVLEFHGSIANYVLNALSATGVPPRLRVILVAVGLDDCKRSLRVLAAISKRRMDEGNPFMVIEPLLVEGEVELEKGFHVEWEEGYKAENTQDLLSN